MLDIISTDQLSVLVKRHTDELASFSVCCPETGDLLPVICSVCDSIPHHGHWHTFIPMKKARKLFRRCSISKSSVLEEYDNNTVLIEQYTAREEQLHEFVLSPDTFVNENDEVLVCKECANELEKRYTNGTRPSEALANNHLIGHAPDVLSVLSIVEASLVGLARIYAQSWVFYAGAHQHIKGWHTFYKGRASQTIGHLMQLNDAGMNGSIVVVLAGPFTSAQKAMTLSQTTVDPLRIIAAFKWLIENNFKFKDESIPHVDDIPLPTILFDDWWV